MVKFKQKNVRFGQNFDIFWQNPVSGPHKHHDGGWKCLIIQQKKLSNFVKFTRKVLKKSQFLIIFLQNPVSGPLKRHDGGWNCLIIQRKNVKYCQIWSNIVENLVKNQAFFREIYSKITKKGFFSAKILIFFFWKIQFQVHINATMADENA